MNNFTKPYIDLCKNKKIQELRPILENDWYFSYNEIRFVKINKYMEGLRNVCYWLPTGDQLDEEIIKICNAKQTMYNFWYEKGFDYHARYINARVNDEPEFVSDNPLIAKLKLLIKLLESE